MTVYVTGEFYDGSKLRLGSDRLKPRKIHTANLVEWVNTRAFNLTYYFLARAIVDV